MNKLPIFRYNGKIINLIEVEINIYQLGFINIYQFINIYPKPYKGRV